MVMNKVPIKIKRLHADAKIPIYGSEEAAGFDLYAIEDVLIKPGELVVVGTGIALEIEQGYCFQFWDRGGMGVKGIHHFAGLIDSDYRGEFKVVLFNSGKQEYSIKKGDRIMQAVVVPVCRAEFEEVGELGDSKRGEGRFHSTGK